MYTFTKTDKSANLQLTNDKENGRQFVTSDAEGMLEIVQ